MKSAIKIIFFIFLSVTVCSGCTSIDSFVAADPNIVELAPSLQTVVVRSDLADYGMAQDMEYALVSELQKYGIYGYSWHDILPPIKEYSKDEIVSVYSDYRITMIIFIDLQDSDVSTSYYTIDGNLTSYTVGTSLFEVTFSPIFMDNPIFVAQLSVATDEGWKVANRKAARRAAKEYAEAAQLVLSEE
jgi:hypothetical protein